MLNNIWTPSEPGERKTGQFPHELQTVAHKVAVKYGWFGFVQTVSNLINIAAKLEQKDPELFRELLINDN